jgi:hypothetical protein
MAGEKSEVLGAAEMTAGAEAMSVREMSMF